MVNECIDRQQALQHVTTRSIDQLPPNWWPQNPFRNIAACKTGEHIISHILRIKGKSLLGSQIFGWCLKYHEIWFKSLVWATCLDNSWHIFSSARTMEGLKSQVRSWLGQLFHHLTEPGQWWWYVVHAPHFLQNRSSCLVIFFPFSFELLRFLSRIRALLLQLRCTSRMRLTSQSKANDTYRTLSNTIEHYRTLHAWPNRSE